VVPEAGSYRQVFHQGDEVRGMHLPFMPEFRLQPDQKVFIRERPANETQPVLHVVPFDGRIPQTIIKNFVEGQHRFLLQEKGPVFFQHDFNFLR
jgi:hypothetical protein